MFADSAKLLSCLPSFGLQPWGHQAGGPVWCGESRDPPRVLAAEHCAVHALDGGDGGEQVRRLVDQTSDVGIICTKKKIVVVSIHLFPLILF